MLSVRLRARRAPAIHIDDVCRTPLRVNVGDLDIYRHVNNGTYLTMADLGRYDWMLRTGLWRAFAKRGWWPVVVNSTTTYRKSLHLGERVILETRFLGVDEKSFYIEHRFTVDGQIRAQTLLRGRFISRTEGTLPIETIKAGIPALASMPQRVPDWAHQWAEDTKLPPSRADAPSVWEDDPTGW